VASLAQTTCFLLVRAKGEGTTWMSGGSPGRWESWHFGGGRGLGVARWSKSLGRRDDWVVASSGHVPAVLGRLTRLGFGDGFLAGLKACQALSGPVAATRVGVDI
jgi:hypothetical protein